MPDSAPRAPADPLAPRRLALRAIMDGRGVDAVILSAAPSLAHYGGAGPGAGGHRLLVVTARAARLVEAADAARAWAEAAALLPPGCALGHDQDVPAAARPVLEGLARPRGMRSIAAEVARQLAGP